MKTELKEYILEKRQVLGAAALGLLISSGVLFLYQLPLEAVWYSALLVCFAEALWLFTGFGKFRKNGLAKAYNDYRIRWAHGLALIRNSQATRKNPTAFQA